MPTRKFRARGQTRVAALFAERADRVVTFGALGAEAPMYIKRKSVAARQKKAIADSLRRLEETAFTASSSSTDEAAIRSKEAEMVSKFVERAKAVEPEGVVVLDGGPDKADLALEDGDIIVIPPKSDVVLVSGEVMALLDEANTSAYGNPEITKVNIGVGTNPGILISGHDLRDLQMLLEQTEGTGVDVYTHSEMLPAHYYPAFKKFAHFKGNYGNACGPSGRSGERSSQHRRS